MNKDNGRQYDVCDNKTSTKNFYRQQKNDMHVFPFASDVIRKKCLLFLFFTQATHAWKWY